MRWGLIGTRGLVVKGCLPAFAEAANADLVAVLSSSPERAESFESDQGVELDLVTADQEQFLGAAFEAVWITSPTFLHYEHGLAALKAGKHVLLEKPLAFTSEQGWELVRAAESSGCILATGYQGRYVPIHAKMKALIEEGAIGDITAARTYYGIKRPGPPPEWRQKRETAHWGALSDIGTHHVDVLRMLLGNITDAQGLMGRQLGFETDDVAVASLAFESGALGSLTISTNSWAEHTRVEVHGTTGALVALDTNPKGQGTLQLLRRGEAAEDIAVETPNAWTAQLETVTRVFGGETLPYATAADGARNLEVMEKIIP